MTIRRQPLARHIISSLLFLLVMSAFFLRYVLIWAGVVESQVAKPRQKDGRVAVVRPAASQDRGEWFKSRARATTAAIEGFAKTNALLRIPFSEFNMGFRKRAGMRLFPDADRVLRLNNGHLVIPEYKLDTAYASGQIAQLHGFCKDRNIPFLYVNAPHKSDPRDPQLPPGMKDFANDNADRLVQSLAAAGVSVLDLRERACAGFDDFYGLFFRTDHHWKPETGLWAALQIAEELNRRFEMNLALGGLAPSNFNATVYQRLFLGSLGKKVTRAYAAPDDFTLITPRYATSFRFMVPHRGIDREGTFRQVLIQDRQLAPGDYYNRIPYSAYLGFTSPLLKLINRDQPDGKRLLVVNESFGNVVVPFLALVSRRIDVIDLRHFSGSVHAYIRQFNPDAVVVLYSAESLIPKSAAAARNHLFRFE